MGTPYKDLHFGNESLPTKRSTKDFVTVDLYLAAFLKASGIDISAIDPIQDDEFTKNNPTSWNRCEFTFRIKDDDEYLVRLVDEWTNDKRCAEIKRVIHFLKILKKQLMEQQYNLKRKESINKKFNNG